MPTTIATPSRPKLPFWSTIGEAYRLVLANPGMAARATGLWALVAAIIYGALYALLGADEIAAMQKGSSIGPAGFNLISLLIGLVVGASIAVAWHRFTLAGEAVASATYLRLDARVWSYISVAGLMLLLTLPFLVSTYLFTKHSIALGAVGSGGQPAELDGYYFSLFPFMLVSMLVSLFLTTRLCLLLPARALGHDGFSWGDSWRLTSGNFWRLFGGGSVCYLPLLAAAVVSGAITPEGQSVTGFLVSSILMAVLGIVLAIIPLGFLSLAYRHFAGAGPSSV